MGTRSLEAVDAETRFEPRAELGFGSEWVLFLKKNVNFIALTPRAEIGLHNCGRQRWEL